ncbi:MAG: zinc ribbon domain-containing protein [Firmicutes bacterium]|nr:zinc ribbon domain-containing protein [Bacillota bacterium]
MPPFLLIGGIVAIAGRRNKIGAIVAGVFFLVAGIIGVYFGSANLPAPDQVGIIMGVVELLGAAFFILGGIFQKGMRMKSAYENRMAYQYQQAQMQAALHPVIPPQPVQPAAPAAAPGWVCECGAANDKDAKFCKACGKQNPATETWTCACGQVNPKEAKFCTRCGQPKPTTPVTPIVQ